MSKRLGGIKGYTSSSSSGLDYSTKKTSTGLTFTARESNKLYRKNKNGLVGGNPTMNTPRLRRGGG